MLDYACNRWTSVREVGFDRNSMPMINTCYYLPIAFPDFKSAHHHHAHLLGTLEASSIKESLTCNISLYFFTNLIYIPCCAAHIFYTLLHAL